MRLTKLGHSCVLVEDDGQTVLFDPGGWSERDLIERIGHIDTIVYTHEHGDHFDIDVLQALIAKSPDTAVVSNSEIAMLISKSGISVSHTEETEDIRKFVAPHENLPVPGVKAPDENGYHFKSLYSHPGDSQSFNETKKVLAMPFIGPWGKTGDSIAKVLELKPEYVLPVHDWHYTDDAKLWLQGLLDSVLSDHGIKLLPNRNGQLIELEL